MITPGAGAIISIAAQPTSWIQAWPNLPELSCIQLVFVAQDGSPAMDRGLNKRTYAGTQDAIVVLEVWPESHCPGFALRQADVFQSYAV